MRFTEFKPSILLESNISNVSDLDTKKAVSDLNALISVSGQLPPEAANVKSKITSNLLALKDKIAGIISNLVATGQAEPIVQEPVEEPVNQQEPTQLPEPQPPIPQTTQPVPSPEEDPITPEEQPVKEAIGGDAEYDTLVATCEELKQEIANIESLRIPEKTKKQLVATITKQLDSVYAMLGKYANVVDELKIERQKREAAEQFVNQVNKLLVQLGNKVQGYTEISKEEFDALSKRAQQIHINAQNFTTTFRQALFSMVLDISSQNKEIDKLSIQQFLEACVTGDVLDMLALTEAGRGNVRDHVKEEYQPMIDLFAEQKVFSWSPGKTAGAIGPGEMALSMMGSPTEKAKGHGDLDIGGTMYEIKAGATSGGRLNSKKILKGPAAWPTWKAGIEKIIKKAAPKGVTWTRKNSKGQEVEVKASNFTANTFNLNKEKGKAKEGAAYNFNYRGLTTLNDDVLIHSTYELTYDLFYNTFEKLITNLDEIRKSRVTTTGKKVLGVSPEKLVSGAINEDGTIDPTAMMAAYTRLAYESYNRADGVEAILFLNTNSLDYTIAKDGKELIGKLNNEITISSGFNFNDDQQSATPAYLAKKIPKQTQ
jgi:hypothetical protein